VIGTSTTPNQDITAELRGIMNLIHRFHPNFSSSIVDKVHHIMDALNGFLAIALCNIPN
jgi:hypothetical protein